MNLKTYTKLRFPGATWTFATGINGTKQIVGFYLDSSNVEHGFLRTP